LARFTTTFKQYIKHVQRADRYFGYDLRGLAKISNLLGFLYEDWWNIEFSGLDRLPAEGPAVIVGNTSGLLPWTPLMLIYALMSRRQNPRRVSVLADMDWIGDERAYQFLLELGFVPWSSANMKRLIDEGDLVAIFPEMFEAKNYWERYRLYEFDWTRLLPAVEQNVKIFPLASIGQDDAMPTFLNLDGLAKFLNIPSYPITPFFPWLPFPVNLTSYAQKWHMHILPACNYERKTGRDEIEEVVKTQARFIEGEIQAEINRMIRARLKRHEY